MGRATSRVARAQTKACEHLADDIQVSVGHWGGCELRLARDSRRLLGTSRPRGVIVPRVVRPSVGWGRAVG